MATVAVDDRDPGRAGAFLVFASPRLEYDTRDIEHQKTLIADAFTGVRWLVPQVLETLPAASELYFDSISRVNVERWSTGRIALLGDAASGVTLGGMGVGAGVVGAYVLAGELAAAGGDHLTAFDAYERRLRGYTARWQRGASPGEFLAPSTATRLWLRNALLRTRLVQRMLVAGTKSIATELDLPGYPVPVSGHDLAA
jgi:2-polyprenyl-6-methoxyphenol hydroxylase-like FAD-dependent oxidoreductase